MRAGVPSPPGRPPAASLWTNGGKGLRCAYGHLQRHLPQPAFWGVPSESDSNLAGMWDLGMGGDVADKLVNACKKVRVRGGGGGSGLHPTATLPVPPHVARFLLSDI